jgi:hypothetical protein
VMRLRLRTDAVADLLSGRSKRRDSVDPRPGESSRYEAKVYLEGEQSPWKDRTSRRWQQRVTLRTRRWSKALKPSFPMFSASGIEAGNGSDRANGWASMLTYSLGDPESPTSLARGVNETRQTSHLRMRLVPPVASAAKLWFAGVGGRK